MNTLLIIVCISLISLTVLFVIPATVEHYRKFKNRKWFKSVQIGDEYIKHKRESNPYLDQWGSVIIIVDKKMGKDGLMYVKFTYRGSERVYNDSFESLIEFSNYVPYTGQDKEQQ